MKVLIAPAQYKETISAATAARLMGQVALKNGLEVRSQAISDGGEGFLEPFLSGGGKEVRCMVLDPLGRSVEAAYVIHKERAIIEMARASGLELVGEAERDVMKSSTFGTGQLILDAHQKGIGEVIVSLGGSATNDGGMGMMRALGVEFSSDKGRIDDFTSACSIRQITLDRFSKIFNNQIVTGACDVTNPLLGEQGATRVYGRQKGAGDHQIQLLEKQMQCYARAVENTVGFDCSKEPGTGAAGGTGFALRSFFNASLTPGFDLVSSAVDLGKWVDWADLVITGEGKLDHQTNFGKAPERLRSLAESKGKEVVAIVGTLEEGAGNGYKAVYSLTRIAGSGREARLHADHWLEVAMKNFIDDFAS